jgi:hypothetical protein
VDIADNAVSIVVDGIQYSAHALLDGKIVALFAFGIALAEYQRLCLSVRLDD